MLTLDNLEILSYGAGTPSMTLVGMSCENAMRGYPVWPEVPIYDAVIFCDLRAEPSWVYRQAAFAADLCRRASIPFYKLDVDLYGDYISRFGKARVSSIPFWTLGEDGKKGRMLRQCTVDYKIKMIERFVRCELLCYRPRERTLSVDKHAHGLHMGIMAEEVRRTKERKAILFENTYLFVVMGRTRNDCYAYNRADCGDMQTFLYKGSPVWTGF